MHGTEMTKWVTTCGGKLIMCFGCCYSLTELITSYSIVLRPLAWSDWLLQRDSLHEQTGSYLIFWIQQPHYWHKHADADWIKQHWDQTLVAYFFIFFQTSHSGWHSGWQASHYCCCCFCLVYHLEANGIIDHSDCFTVCVHPHTRRPPPRPPPPPPLAFGVWGCVCVCVCYSWYRWCTPVLSISPYGAAIFQWFVLHNSSISSGMLWTLAKPLSMCGENGGNIFNKRSTKQSERKTALVVLKSSIHTPFTK